jgi:hypothetical protein
MFTRRIYIEQFRGRHFLEDLIGDMLKQTFLGKFGSVIIQDIMYQIRVEHILHVVKHLDVIEKVGIWWFMMEAK